MKKLAIGIVVGLLVGGATIAVAQGLALSPGTYDLEEGQYVFNVPALGATAVPVTDTPIAPTDTPVPDNSVWHLPSTHEHGDAPPQWVLDSPMVPSFDRGEAHPGYKGFLVQPGEPYCCGTAQSFQGEIYFIPHIISTPAARLTRTHTYQLWILDEAGGVSYFQGRLDTGDPSTNRFSELPSTNISPRLMMLFDQKYPKETWYGLLTPIGSPDIFWLTNGPNYEFNPPESKDQSTWVAMPEPNIGNYREVGIVFYKYTLGVLFDEVFCVGPQSDAVPMSGMVDCSEPGALPQFLASTLPEGEGSLGQSNWRVGPRLYPCPDCELPN